MPAKKIPDFIEPVEGKVQLLPLSKLDLDDTTFMFRAALRIGDLKKSIQEQGQQLPILVRRRKKYDRSYQIISGFRRTTAIKEIGWDAIAAIDRDDLMGDDEGAFKVAVLENTARKTYSDIDRANVIKTYEDRGYSSIEVAELMGLKKRQKNHLKSLLKLPKEVQDAIDDDDQYFKTTHALQLKQMKGRYPELDYSLWIAAVDGDELSISQLVRRVNEKYRKAEKPGFQSIFNENGTEIENRVIRLMPLKLELDNMSPGERKTLKAELLNLAGMV